MEQLSRTQRTLMKSLEMYVVGVICFALVALALVLQKWMVIALVFVAAPELLRRYKIKLPNWLENTVYLALGVLIIVRLTMLIAR